jgi:hypothetical protein
MFFIGRFFKEGALCKFHGAFFLRNLDVLHELGNGGMTGDIHDRPDRLTTEIEVSGE